ncbi:MAG: 4-hydroxy-3-methylbut-2-enyl diphosphate reductase, partial [Psychrobium sp.]
ASAPEILVNQVIEKLVELTGGEVVENPGIVEDTVFAVPVELR